MKAKRKTKKQRAEEEKVAQRLESKRIHDEYIERMKDAYAFVALSRLAGEALWDQIGHDPVGMLDEYAMTGPFAGMKIEKMELFELLERVARYKREEQEKS